MATVFRPGAAGKLSGARPSRRLPRRIESWGTDMTAERAAVPALHAAWGAVLVCIPARLLELTGGVPSPTASRVLRVLGARHLSQAAITAARPGPAALRMGSAVEHAARGKLRRSRAGGRPLAAGGGPGVLRCDGTGRRRARRRAAAGASGVLVVPSPTCSVVYALGQSSQRSCGAATKPMRMAALSTTFQPALLKR